MRGDLDEQASEEGGACTQQARHVLGDEPSQDEADGDGGSQSTVA